MISAPVKPFLDELFRLYFDLRDLLPVAPWARENIVLTKEISPAHPGPYDPEKAPLSTILFDWYLDPQWREFIGVKSSQAGFTQAALVLICYIIEHQLGHVLFAMDSAGRAKDLNNERLKPMITEGCKSIGRFVPEVEDKKLQNMVLILKGLKVWLAGAKSAGQLASRTIPNIFGDEVDEWEEELRGGESNALDLLRDRGKLIERFKMAVFSKPRNAPAPDDGKDERKAKRRKKDQGIIWGEYLTGSRHKCFVPCPHCEHSQELVWEQVRFGHCRAEDGKSWNYRQMLSETYYECVKCRGHILEHHKREMLAKREWKQTNHGHDDYKPIPRKFSCHASDLYSLFIGSSWGDLAVEYVSAQTTSQKRKFRRSRLGLPVEEKVIAQARLTTILKLQGKYRRGEIPKKPVLVALLADVQQTLVKWLKLGFLLDGTCYIIDYGSVEDENELIGEMNKPVKVLDWGDTPERQRIDPTSRIGLIDEGDGKQLKRILDFCISPRAYKRIFPCKGRGGKQTEHMKDRVTVQKNRTHKGKPLARYLMDHEYFLDEIYEDRIGRFDEIAAAESKGEAPPVPRLWLFSEPDTELCQEFCAETKDWHIENGQLVFGWQPKPPSGMHNDWSDCLKEGMALWFVARPLILKKLAAGRHSAADEAEDIDKAGEIAPDA